MSYQKNIYHIVFSTYKRQNTIETRHEREMYAYMLGIMRNLGAFVHRIGGMPDHVHILVDIPAKIAVSDFVRTLKSNTTAWVKEQNLFHSWSGWSEGYGVFTCSFNDKDNIIRYIKSQKEHHSRESFVDEYRSILSENGISPDEWFPSSTTS